MRIAVFLFPLLTATLAMAEDAITHVRWLPPTPSEQAALDDVAKGRIHPLPLPFTPYNTTRPKVPLRREVVADRNEYMADDPVGQFIVVLLGDNVATPKAALEIKVLEGAQGEKVIATKTFTPVEQPKVAFLLNTRNLPPGTYRMQAALQNAPVARKIKECVFSKSKESRKVLPFPKDGVPLVVHTQSHIPDVAWPITTGVPLPRQAADSVDRFVLMENGKPVPAQFSQRATWYPHGMVKWMGLDFQAKYDGGKPREYRLKLLPSTAIPLTSNPLPRRGEEVTSQRGDGGIPSPPLAPKAFGVGGEGRVKGVASVQTNDLIVVDTGAIRFKVNRRAFAGIEEVAFLNADGSAGKPVVSGAGGPFLMDERNVRYSSASDQHPQVILEETGPVRVTICAKGWYTSDDRAEKCAMYQTRISAYAGQPWINVNHRTIITYDTDKKKLRELGFAVKVPGGKTWAFGGDGATKSGELPPPGKDQAGKPLPPPSVWLHQDRWDHFRLMQGTDQAMAERKKSVVGDGWMMTSMEGADQAMAEGKKSDGWATIGASDGSVSVAFRNIWQLYPKELELSQNELNVHIWPRHGRVAFTEEEEFGMGSIYKLFYAHQGAYLDLKFPQKYFDAIRKMMVAMEQQDINALTGNGLGLATTSDFCLYFDTARPEPAKAAAWARLYQQDPHAITDPVYNGLTEVEGRFAGKSDKLPEVQRLLTDAYHGYTMSVDYLQDYGMWIWPDVHNNWSPISKQAQWHRWWHLSHYQNVWEGLFLYWRSGEPWLYEWGQNNSRHYMDVGTVNYDDPRNPMLCKIAGANYHTKGFTPWGTPRQGERCGDDYCEVGGHFINPDANLFRYLLLGDRHGLELCQAWGQSFQRVALPPERSRDCNTTLGEMLSYYENTWDPQGILYFRDLVNDQNSRPWKEDGGFPAHPMFHDRWVIRYWNLTRDPMIKQRILEWFTPDFNKNKAQYAYPQLRALAWQWTGNKEYLTEYLPEITTMWDDVYLNPDDPLNYFGARKLFFPTHSQAQTMPYFLQALFDAGIEKLPPREYNGAPVTKVTSPKKDAGFGLLVEKSNYWDPKIAYLMPVGAEPIVTLEILPRIQTIDPTLPQGASTVYIRIEDADGKVLFDSTIASGSMRPTASITLDARKNKAPWRIYKNAVDPSFKWTGLATDLFVGPTPETVRDASQGKKAEPAK